MSEYNEKAMNKKNFDSKLTDREIHEKMAMIENLIWEIARIMEPNSYINPEKIKKARDNLLKILNE